MRQRVLVHWRLLPERQRERLCKRCRVAENGGSVGCKNGRWRNRPFWYNRGSWRKDYLIVRNYFNGEEILHSLIIIVDAWRHLVLWHLIPFPQNELGVSCEWVKYDLFGILICEWARHELWIRWEWSLWDNNFSLCPAKNSSNKCVQKWGQAGNEL